MLTTNTHECYLARRSAIVNDQLSALELAITPNMGHWWASDVALSNIHERYLFTSLFYFI